MSSKRIRRPWDKRAAAARKKNASPEDEPPPFVQLDDGVKFYSDRFYLNTSIYEERHRQPQTAPGGNSSSCCCCGAQEPPPLFSRSKLVQFLDLKAVILGTFSLEPRALIQEFPTLFGPGACVPTLLMHGKKGWTVTDDGKAAKSGKKKGQDDDDDYYDDDDVDDPESAPLEDDCCSHGGGLEDDDETSCASCASCAGCSIGTQDEAAVEASKKYARNVKAFVDIESLGAAVNNHNKNKSAATQQTRRPIQFPESIHFSEITPTWLPQDAMPTTYAQAVDPATGTLNSWIVQKRIYQCGVHHPKYMILLERDGSVVVVISTSNLTVSRSTEGSWIQRFPPAAFAGGTAKPAGCSPSSDFGAVLANFLQCQMLATAAGQLTAHAFVRRYLNWKSLASLEHLFDYSRAQVHLIATVPGEHEGRHSNLHRRRQQQPQKKDEMSNSKNNFFYGPQRIADVLAHRKIPPSLQDDGDRLIYQPTSFGGDWDSRSMSNMVRLYLGHDDPSDSPIPDHDILQRLDIVWPTDHFIRQASQMVRDSHRGSPTAVVSAPDFSLGFASFAESVRDKKMLETEKMNGRGKMFFSSEAFNRLHWDCLARMVIFESSVPAQRPTILSPHFKSAARLFDGKTDYRIRKELGVPKCEAYFSWFLLTSACLSKGAQGEATVNPSPGSDAMSYSNFELGVLFTSRKDRLYCWKPSSCICCFGDNSGNTTTKTTCAQLIHLPSPYCFRAAPYVPDEDDMEFCETPYFHEILRDNACVGNMLSTPYGAALAKQYAKKCERL